MLSLSLLPHGDSGSSCTFSAGTSLFWAPPGWQHRFGLPSILPWDIRAEADVPCCNKALYESGSGFVSRLLLEQRGAPCVPWAAFPSCCLLPPPGTLHALCGSKTLLAALAPGLQPGLASWWLRIVSPSAALGCQLCVPGHRWGQQPPAALARGCGVAASGCWRRGRCL